RNRQGIRNRWRGATMRSNCCSRTAAIPLPRLIGFLGEDPRSDFGHCLRAAIIVRGVPSPSDPRLPRAWSPSRRSAQTSTTRRAVTRPRRVLGLRAIRRLLSNATAPSSSTIRAIFWRSWSRNAVDFRLGRRRMMRDRLSQVLPEWDAAMPGYASVLAMYAFALEENGQYRRAEKMARRALTLDPRHAGAIHVVVHVM